MSRNIELRIPKRFSDNLEIEQSFEKAGVIKDIQAKYAIRKEDLNALEKLIQFSFNLPVTFFTPSIEFSSQDIDKWYETVKRNIKKFENTNFRTICRKRNNEGEFIFEKEDIYKEVFKWLKVVKKMGFGLELSWYFSI